MLSAAATKRASLALSAASARTLSDTLALGGGEWVSLPRSSWIGETVASWWIRPPSRCRLTIRPFHGFPARVTASISSKKALIVLGAAQQLRGVRPMASSAV